jgi:hypothetical protein
MFHVERLGTARAGAGWSTGSAMRRRRGSAPFYSRECRAICGALGTPRRLSRSGCLRILAIQTRWYRRGATGGPRRSPYPAVAPPMLSGNRASFDGSRSLCGFSNQACRSCSRLFACRLCRCWAAGHKLRRISGRLGHPRGLAAGPRMRVERERVLALLGGVGKAGDRIGCEAARYKIQAVRSRVTCLLGAPRRVALHSPAHRRGPSSSTSPDQHARRFQPV